MPGNSVPGETCCGPRGGWHIRCSWFVLSVFVEKCGETVELAFRRVASGFDPSGKGIHTCGLEAAIPHAADFLGGNDSGSLQHLQMLHHRGERHGEWLRQLSDCRRCAA